MRLPRTLEEALKQGYEVVSEDASSTKRERERIGRMLLQRHGGDEEPDGSVISFVESELVVPFTATYKFGRPRPRKKDEFF